MKRFTLIIAVAMLAVATLAGIAVAQDLTGPIFDDCTVDADWNAADCTVSQEATGLNDFDRDSGTFWVRIEDVEYGGDSKAPQVLWLYHNGYREQEDDLYDVSRHDVNNSGPVRTRLEQHSTCQLTADVASHGQYTVTTTLGQFTYNDEPDGNELHAGGFMQGPVTVEADQIRITDGDVYCRFDMVEILDKGMHPDGEFQSWNGREPVIGDEIGSSGSVSIQFSDGGYAEQQQRRENASNVYVVGGNLTVDGGTVELGDNASVTVDSVGKKKEGESWVESAIGGITDAVGGDGITGAILRGVTGIFLETLRALLEILVKVIVWTPDVNGNPAVENINTLTLQVAFAVSTLVVMITGVLYMTGPVFGFSYAELRLVIPRLIAALAFGTVSLPLLQLCVDFTNLLVDVFIPPELTLAGLFGIGVATLLVIIIDGIVLLAVAVLFIIRGAYILFIAAIAPLIAVVWSVPRAKRYADTFISGWFAALLMAPIDILVIRLMIELFQSGGPGALTAAANWIFGLAAAVLLLWIPKQLFSASQAMIGKAGQLSRKAQYTAWKHGGMERVADRAGYTDEYRSAMGTLYGPRWEQRKEYRDQMFQKRQMSETAGSSRYTGGGGGRGMMVGLHTTTGEEYVPPWERDEVDDE
ncbi:DUF805 domain-containing protein [Halogeometricum borinquense]|uniref:DUF805 domain-containing protein n=1 Tax=Halogeometricum borinquense TaxID=60847 RepID=A0A6C0ULC4_9EURY|nr:DUF805 domain-containing protein [Halogeometricum borinquense]QIB75393.1 DUF805 domain-containing protein [Halogeometricum borinquense]